MYKLLYPHSFTDGPAIRQITGDFSKIASYTPPEISAYLKEYEPVAGKSLLLVNALGAGEKWGANVNGDYFPEASLMHKGASHGYKTFEKYAHVYRHHVNKDPAKSMGRVKVAAYNKKMHRVELLLEVDNVKAAGLLKKIAAGEHPDWSMGCKVPFDVCSICDNQAKKVANYCECLKYAMGKIAANGKRHYAINTFPRFFDISEVMIGADKTAKTLKKVASDNSELRSSAVLGLIVYGEDDTEKTADQKRADLEKIVITSSPYLTSKTAAVIERLRGIEPDIPGAILSKLAAAFSLPEILSTTSYAGIVLTPQEFQRVILEKTGKATLADTLEKQGIVLEIADHDEAALEGIERDEETINPIHVKEAAFRVIEPWVKHRSILEAYVHDRIERSKTAKALERKPETAKTATDAGGLVELLGSMGLAYLLYRRGFPAEAKTFERLLIQKPWMAPVIAGGAAASVNVIHAIAGPSPEARARQVMQNSYVKVGGVGKTMATWLGPIGLAYLASASVSRKRMSGRPVTGVEDVLETYPGPLGIAGAWGATKLRGAAALKALSKFK